MKLEAEATDKLKAIQCQFSSFFPYLKLEFYKTIHGYKQASLRKDMIDSDERIGAHVKTRDRMEIQLDRKMTVEMLEKQFAAFGLPVQVFRKSGTLWIETSLTENWSLEQQNSEGESISSYVV